MCTPLRTGSSGNRDSFDHFARLLRRVASARSNARGTSLNDLLKFAEQAVPAR